MPRKARVEFPGAVYHLLDRGERREAIVRDDLDGQSFLRTLGQVCGRTGWRVHAFALMSNHYHLLVETPFRRKVGKKVVEGYRSGLRMARSFPLMTRTTICLDSSDELLRGDEGSLSRVGL